MSTEAQILANQANAQLSTSPRTPEGKTVSSLNCFRHGFRSKSVLFPGDDPAEYQSLLDELSAHFSASEMADAEWRLRRPRIHQVLATEALTKEVAVCLRYESQLERQHDSACRA